MSLTLEESVPSEFSGLPLKLDMGLKPILSFFSGEFLFLLQSDLGVNSSLKKDPASSVILPVVGRHYTWIYKAFSGTRSHRQLIHTRIFLFFFNNIHTIVIAFFF